MSTRFTTRRALLLASLVVAALLALPSLAHALTRDQVLARGKVWVDKNVPYSQSRYATVPGVLISATDSAASSKGYRTDCSGFVSMCLGLVRSDGVTPMSYDTAGLPGPLDKITRGALQPGDVVLRPKNPSAGITGHTVIFVRWNNVAEGTYLAYEESSSRTGTIAKIRDLDADQAAGFSTWTYPGIEDDFADVQARISGIDRYECAASAAQTSYPGVAAAVVIANGENWPDALGGAALAGAVDGPLLLTKPGTLPTVTKNELLRLKPSRVFVLGGTASVSDAVASRIASYVPEVVRLGGRDRYETAASVARAAVYEARKAGRNVDTAYLATGENFPDALAVAPISAARVRPILLVRPAVLPASTASALRDTGVTSAIVLGGEASVGAKVASDVSKTGVSVSRIADRDRYSTAVLVARHGVSLGLGWAGCGLSSGDVFADALAGGPAQGKAGSVMLLTRGVELPARVGGQIEERASDIDRMRVYGGMNTVTQQVREDVAEILRAAE